MKPGDVVWVELEGEDRQGVVLLPVEGMDCYLVAFVYGEDMPNTRLQVRPVRTRAMNLVDTSKCSLYPWTHHLLKHKDQVLDLYETLYAWEDPIRS